MTIVNFNQEHYKTNLALLENKKEIATRLLHFSTMFTGKKEIATAEEIQKAIKEKTNFPNIEAGASLLGLFNEYQYLIENLPFLDLTDLENTNESGYQIKSESLTLLKEQATTRLSVEKESIYKKLTKICDLVNEVGFMNQKHIKFDHEGTASVNILSLHNNL
jgi:hypothetical protein